MQHPKLIRAVDLDRWADTAESKVRFPELVRRLIHASIPKKDLELIDFLGGEESSRPGFDGRTKSKGGSSKVPEGMAWWELGTDQAVRRKLDRDFEKRSADNPEAASATYIAVTPRDFQSKGDWAAEKKKLGFWRDVRVYDSNDLEQWLEEAPSVARWFLQIAGMNAVGFSDLSSYWESLQGTLKHRLPPKALLVSRAPVVEAFKGWLEQRSGLLSIRAESPQEVVDVFGAWVATLAGEEQAAVTSRAVIVDRSDSWRQLVDSGAGLILIRAEQLELSQELLGEAVQKGHHVLLPMSALSPDTDATIKLQRMNRFELEGVLREAGISEQDVHLYAQHSGGSFSILKRQMTTLPLVRAPKWASGEAIAELAPLLLVGAWRDGSEADRSAVAQISGRSYDEVSAILNRWRTEPDAPVRWANGEWEFVSPQDAWTFLAKAVTPAHLTSFEKVATAVLGADDPRFDLAREDRWMAGIRGKLPPASEALRRGLAQTLALLGTREAGKPVADTIPLGARVYRTVTAILKDSSWRRWASLGQLLSVLAEAAPESVLDTAEADLDSSDPELPKLFREESNGLSGRAEHTGVLWALERIAWAPEHLSRASILLARLAECDPGGQWANRPDASLRDTFCPWLPHTAALPEQRIEAVELIFRRYPAVGWQLLIKLLPEQMGTISSRSLPEWRYWAEKWRRSVTHAEFAQVSIAYMNAAISVCEKSPEKWLDLFNHFANFPPGELERAISAMDKTAGLDLPGDLRLKTWLGLTEEIQRHRYFSKAQWSIKPEILERLAVIAEKFRPIDPVEQALPLFKEGLDRIGDETMSFSEQEMLTQKLRAEKVLALTEAHGFDAVKRLAGSAGEPWSVGVALVDARVDKYDADVLPALLRCGDQAIESFAQGYAARRANVAGWGWISSQPFSRWKPEEAAAMLSLAPFERKTWEFVETLGSLISAEYWRIVRHYFQGSAGDVEYLVRKLVSAGRSDSALDVLGMASTKKAALPPMTMLELFELSLRTIQSGARPLRSSLVEDVLEELQKSEGLDESRMATLEWSLLPAFRGNLAPVTLQRNLCRNSAFFVEMLVLHYRPKHRDKSKDSELPKDQKAQAQRAAILLNDWKRLPGTRKDGSVDGVALVAWVHDARKRAATVDRIEVCDIVIGKIFAHAPGEADGSWPSVPVRDLLETIGSRDLEHGLENGIINKRGVYSKSPTDGGRQERALAEQYEAFAVKAQSRWPRTAAVLRRIVANYLVLRPHKQRVIC